MIIGASLLWFNDVLKELIKGDLRKSDRFDYSIQAKKAIDVGFNHIELVMNMYYFLPNSRGNLTKENMEKLKLLKEANGITYSVHLPFWSVDPSSYIEEIRKSSVDVYVKSIQAVEELNPTTYVLHATSGLAAEIYGQKLEDSQKKACIRLFAENSRKTVEELIEHMSSMGISSRKLALESIKFPFSHSIELANEFNTSVCVDVGHILEGFPGDMNVEEAMRASAGRIGEIHVHDVYRNVDGSRVIVKDHLPLGSGCLNTRELINLIEYTKFDGPIILEMKFEDAVSSLEKLKSIIMQPLKDAKLAFLK